MSLFNSKKRIFNPKKDCAICRNSGYVRKWNFYFLNNRKAKVCVFCATTNFNSSSEISNWLTKNSIFSKKGSLVGLNKFQLSKSKKVRVNLYV
jgi:hypothetical protein